MKPYSQIHVGDVYASPLKWTGSDITYTVVAKDDAEKLIEVRSSYGHPSLPATMWRETNSRIFRQRLIKSGKP